jgi:hypothetical protein
VGLVMASSLPSAGEGAQPADWPVGGRAGPTAEG